MRRQDSHLLVLQLVSLHTIGISVNADRAGITLMNFAGNPVTEVIRTEDLDIATASCRITAVMRKFITCAGLAAKEMFGIGFGITGYLADISRYNTPLPQQDWSLLELGPHLSR